MKVDTMRAIDYWVGVPLCFLLQVLTYPWRQCHGPTDKVQRVLFIELSEMGSTIIADPAMRKLKDQGKELFFVIFKRNAVSLKLLDTIPEENIFTIREDSLLSLATDILRFLKWVRVKKIDSVLDLELFSRITSLLTMLTFAPNRVGFHAFYNEGLYRGDILTHKIAYNPHQHVAKNFIAMVNGLLAEKAEIPYSKTLIPDKEIELKTLHFTNKELEPVKAKLSNLLGANDWDTKNISRQP